MIRHPLTVEHLESRQMLSGNGYGPVDGSARDIGIGANGAGWVIGTNRVDANGFEIYRWLGTGWQKVQGAASRISVDPGGNAWIVNEQGGIYRWGGSGWSQVTGSARDVGVGSNGSAWVVGTNRVNSLGYEIYRWTGSGWQVVPGQASRIAVDPSGNAWIVNDANEIWRWTGSAWDKLPGAARDIGIGPDGTTWVVGVNPVPGGFGCWRWVGNGWAGTASGAVQIAVGPSGHPWVVNDGGTIFFGPGVARDALVLPQGSTNTEAVAVPPGHLELPVAAMGTPVVNTGTISGPGSFISVNGGGTLQQGGAINAQSLNIGNAGSSSPGLGLSDGSDFSTTVNLAGDATITAPSGVTVEGILGLSSGNIVSANTPVNVLTKGLLRGNGVVAGALTVVGSISPAGTAAGTPQYGKLTIGQLTLAGGSRVELQIGGPTPGTDHDQVVVSSSISIDGSKLVLVAGYAPPAGSSIVLVDNKGTGAVVGSFRDAQGNSLAEGANVVANLAGTGIPGRISYKGGDGNDIVIKLAVDPPTAPTAVTGTVGNGQVNLSWSAPSSNGGSAVTDYAIRYSSDNGATWTRFVDAVSPANSATVTGLTNGVTYVFKVSALNAAGAGAPSATSIPLKPLSTPGAPTALSGLAGNGQVALSWTAPGSNGGSNVTDYVIRYSSNNGLTWTRFTDSVSSATSATVTGLTNGKAYVFRVLAVNALGLGAPSATSATVTPATSPGSPTSVKGTVGSKQVALSWSAPVSNGGASIIDYVVQFSRNNGSTWTTFSDSLSTSTSATVTGLTAGVSYVFRVAAVNAAGTGAFSTKSAVFKPRA